MLPYDGDKNKMVRTTVKYTRQRARQLYRGNKKPVQLTSAFLILSIFLLRIYNQTSEIDVSFKPTWTAKAAKEAEAVAAVPCSGHGRAFYDGRSPIGVHLCECNNCYSGSDCSLLDTYCHADVVTGDAMFLEKYWMEQKSHAAVVVPAWHRMSYYCNVHSSVASDELADQITLLHKLVGNAKVDPKYIVFGNGVTQLLTGLVIALSQHRSSLPDDMAAKVVADVPYYPVFKKQTNFFRYKGYRWGGNASDHRRTDSPKDFIELVTSPNNPDGKIKFPRIPGALTITDRVYYWPHYTAINRPADDEIMLFSMSKLTGHAGSRFGWAIIKNETVYKKMLEYMVESSEGTSHDAQLRALIVVKEVIKQLKTSPESSHDIFEFGYLTLRMRWEKLNNLVSSSKRFRLQALGKQDCSYSGKNKDPSPAFGWLKCEWEEDNDCQKILEDGLIKTIGGTDFDTSSRYARLSLIKTEDDYDQMMEKLKHLVNEKRF